jgi:hypothetical protein
VLSFLFLVIRLGDRELLPSGTYKTLPLTMVKLVAETFKGCSSEITIIL